MLMIYLFNLYEVQYKHIFFDFFKMIYLQLEVVVLVHPIVIVKV